jgi:glycosyltransferase involved in cell wall biosynthesis
MPKISVIICTYNCANLLNRAMASVLAQVGVDFELLIIDDASVDETEKIVEAWLLKDKRIKYFKNDHNLGIAKSRNYGVSLAQGEFIAMLDSDDYWLVPDKLAQQAAYLEYHPLVGLIGTAIRLETESGAILKNDIYAGDDAAIRQLMLWKNQFAQSSVLFRQTAFIKAGGYDVNLEIGEDYDLWLKIGRDYQLANLTAPLTAYLVNQQGITKQKRLLTILATDRIIRRYRKDYPGYLKARLKTILRLIRVR